ncbi:MAG: MFS transporter [Candidatus Micrarchaeota archaeon]|nr:MFS transporter [Candidatus Micrarchaeota archaeon]
MADRSLLPLTIMVAFQSLASAVTGIFLPNYYLQIGLSIAQIIALIGVTMFLVGIVPLITLKLFPKYFEKLLPVGIFLGMVFYALLMFVKSPLILGLAWGLTLATFWPSFNLLLFRFTKIKNRGLVVSLLYVAVPTITGIIGPFLGGVLIHFFTFNILFIVGIILLAVALAFSLRIRYEPVEGEFRFPTDKASLLFGTIIILFGFASAFSFMAYPLFLNKLTGGFLKMGIVDSVLVLIFAIISLIAGRISRVERHRVNFMVIGLVLAAVWLIAMAFVQNIPELVGASVISGISGALVYMLFALYGDFFKRGQHAMLVVLWEIFLMFGRLANLPVMQVYLSSFDFKGYFLVSGLISLAIIVPLLMLKRMHSMKLIRADAAQI